MKNFRVIKMIMNNESDFYKSKAWRKLRSVAIRLHGKRCAKCGQEGTKYHPIHVDHIKPRSLYEHLSLDITNLQILCKQCNIDKSNNHCTDYRSPDSINRTQQYVENPKLLPTLAFENAGIFLTTKQQRLEQSIADKIKNKKENPRPKKIDTRSPSRRRKDRYERIAVQVDFLTDINNARHIGNYQEVIDRYVELHGISTTRELVKRCNIKHLVGERPL